MDIFFQPICIVSVILLKMKMFSIFSVFFMRKSGKIQEKYRKNQKKSFMHWKKSQTGVIFSDYHCILKNNGLFSKKSPNKMI